MTYNGVTAKLVSISPSVLRLDSVLSCQTKDIQSHMLWTRKRLFFLTSRFWKCAWNEWLIHLRHTFLFLLGWLILYVLLSLIELSEEFIRLYTVCVGSPGLYWSKGMTDPVSFFLVINVFEWNVAIVLFHLASFKYCLWDLTGTGKFWVIWTRLWYPRK